MKNILLPKIFRPFECHDIIRLGKEYDSGYLVNYRDVFKSATLLSFGVGSDISFEEDFVELNDVKVRAYDGTISESDHAHFYKEGRTQTIENISSKNIDLILEKETSCFIKCDIDDSEYDILDSLINNSHRITGLAIEFHNVSGPDRFNELTNFISKFDLRLIHTHINNYSYMVDENGMYYVDVIELSFSSTKESTKLSRDILLPHRFDMRNNPHDEEFRILF